MYISIIKTNNLNLILVKKWNISKFLKHKNLNATVFSSNFSISGHFTGKNGPEIVPTDCYREINRYDWRPSRLMKKMNGGLHRVTRFTHDI